MATYLTNFLLAWKKPQLALPEPTFPRSRDTEPFPRSDLPVNPDRMRHYDIRTYYLMFSQTPESLGKAVALQCSYVKVYWCIRRMPSLSGPKIKARQSLYYTFFRLPYDPNSTFTVLSMTSMPNGFTGHQIQLYEHSTIRIATTDIIAP